MKIDLKKELQMLKEKNKDSENKIVRQKCRVTNPEVFGKTIKQVLKQFHIEDVIISINQETLNFSSIINPKAKMIINDKQYGNSDDSQAFYHSFHLEQYDHNIDPEISYKNNIVSMKFFKIIRKNSK